MRDVNCPYCGEEQDINHDDCYGYDEDRTYQQECNSCDKVFIFNTTISLSYDVEKADCLNPEGQHEWKQSITYPRRYTKMRCVICDTERTPTDDELLKILEEK